MDIRTEISMTVGLLSLAGALVLLLPTSTLVQTQSVLAISQNVSKGIAVDYKDGIIIINLHKSFPPIPWPPSDCLACNFHIVMPDNNGRLVIIGHPDSVYVLTEIGSGAQLNSILAKQQLEHGTVNLLTNSTKVGGN
jgi:hypothetical protein